MQSSRLTGVRVHDEVERCQERVKCLEIGDWLEAKGILDRKHAHFAWKVGPPTTFEGFPIPCYSHIVTWGIVLQGVMEFCTEISREAQPRFDATPFESPKLKDIYSGPDSWKRGLEPVTRRRPLETKPPEIFRCCIFNFGDSSFLCEAERLEMTGLQRKAQSLFRPLKLQ